MLRIRLVATAALLALAATTSTALAHGGGSANYISNVESSGPAAGAAQIEVLDRDDRIEVRNTGDRTIVVEGYNDEPYVKLSGDGTVEVNTRSPALYLNEDRFAEVETPASADADAAPVWRVENRAGRFDWHDHRIHWMARSRPEKVTDPGERTKVFDWEIPVRVDGRAGAITGSLFWVGEQGFPLVAGLLGLGALCLAGLALVVVVRRRRRAAGATPRAGAAGEAW